MPFPLCPRTNHGGVSILKRNKAPTFVNML